MPPIILPLKAILLQVLFLAIAIAIEAFVWRRKLHLPRRTTVEFAMATNLLAAVVGWLVFFLVQRFLMPRSLQIQLVSYIFFSNFVPNSWMGLSEWLVILICFGVFLMTYIVKAKGLSLMQWMEVLPPSITIPKKDVPKVLTSILPKIHRQQNFTLLVGHSVSHSAILIILFVLNLRLLG